MQELSQHLGLGTPKVGTNQASIKIVDLGKVKNRISVEGLNPDDYKDLPPAIKFVIAKLENNPQLVNQIQHLLKVTLLGLKDKTLEYETFVDAVVTPKTVHLELFRIFGITPDEGRKAFTKIGFSQKNKMHMDPYYIAFAILYYYGSKHNNIILRQSALALMLVKIFRGRITKFWIKGWDIETVKYVQNYKLKNNHLFKKYPNTFDAIVYYWARTIDDTYWQRVRDFPTHERRGIYSILTASLTRIRQQYTGLSRHYYVAFKAGYKTGNYKYEEQIEERQKLNNVQQITDRIYKNMSMLNVEMSSRDTEYLRATQGIKIKVIEDFDSFTRDPHNEDEVKEIIELFLTVMNTLSAADLANIHIVNYAEKVSKLRDKEQPLRLKNAVTNVMKYIYGKSLMNISSSKQLKLRKAFFLMFILKIKQPYQKKENYFEISTF